jgi:hypothetical protein
MALAVGTMTNWIPRCSASRLTSSMTGSLPVPVPITRHRHCQGIFSASDIGVCPKVSRNCFDGFFFRLRTSPLINHHIMFVGGAVNLNGPKRKSFKLHSVFLYFSLWSLSLRQARLTVITSQGWSSSSTVILFGRSGSSGGLAFAGGSTRRTVSSQRRIVTSAVLRFC